MATPGRRWLAGAAFLMLAAADVSAQWKVAPDITVRETYTDNVFFGSGPRTEDFITQVTPGIRIDGRSPRLTASLDYRPSALFYARENDFNDVVNNLAAFGRLEAVEKFFFVDAAASITQNFVSPFARQPGDITTISLNRFESRTLSVSPYASGRLGGEVEYEVRNRQTYTQTDSDALGDVYTHRWTGRVAGPVRLLGWALEYDDTVTEYPEFRRQSDQKSRLYRGRLFFQPDAAWRFSASAGREQNNFVLNEMQEETIYGGGVAWRPGPRTSVDLELEHRFFGPYRLARFDHRTRLTAWHLGYVRDSTNYQTEVLRLPAGSSAALLDSIFAARIQDPNERRSAVEQFVRNTGTPAFLNSSLAFYTERVFLREALDASFAILGARNSISVSAFYAENTEITPDALALFPDAFLLGERFTQRGFGLHADHRLAPSTSLAASVNVSYTRHEQPASGASRDTYGTLTVNHELSPKTTAFAGVSSSRYEAQDLVLSNQDTTSVFAGLTHRF